DAYPPQGYNPLAGAAPPSVSAPFGGELCVKTVMGIDAALEIPYSYRDKAGHCRVMQDFQDSPDDEEDTKSRHEYLNDLEEEYQATSLLEKSKRFFKKGTQRFSSAKATDQTECHKYGKKGHFARDCWSKTSVSTYHSPFQPKPLSSSQQKPELRPTKDFEAKYNKIKAKLALLSSSSSASSASIVKNKGLIAKAYEWDEEEVSSDDNKMVEVKVLMALAEENDDVSKEGAINGEWVKIFMRKVLVLKQAKLDFLTMQRVNTEILKENKNLRTELKELKAITKTWLNSSNKVNTCNSEQIPSQKKRIPGVDQLTEDSSSSGLKDLVFVKSSADNTKVTIPGVERPWLSEVDGFILPNHDTGRILPSESQRNITDPLVAVTDSSATDYDSVYESLVYSTPLPLLKKLDGSEPISRPKTIKLILRSKSTFKAKTLKSVIINEPSSAPAKGNKSFLASKVHSAPAGKLKSVKIEDDPPLAICERTDHRTCDHAEYISTMNMSHHLKSLGRMSSRPNIPRPSKYFFPPCIHYGGIDHLSNECLYYPICKLCGSYDHDTNGHNRINSLEREINPRNPQHFFKKCEACGSLNHTTTDHYDIEWFKRGKALQAKKAEALKSIRAESSNANRSKTATKRWVSKQN
ncbi:retrovirus-related pol polyprotein from transposon TNT 1-94, partial [Tanacetum coccineum]